MHQYSAGPEGSFGYDGAGRLDSLVTDNESYRYDALGRLKELRLGAGVAVQEMEALPAGSVQDSGTWVVTNQYLEETSAGGGRIHWSPAAGLRKFSFEYMSEHDPADPDGDEDQDPDHFDPEYYAQAVLRANQYTSGEYAGEWKFLAVVIQPDGVYLRQWDHDEVTELGGVAVGIPKDEWHSVTIELSGADGSHVVVKHRLHDASEPQTIEADTTILGDGDLGFGVGEKAYFRFDNAGTDVVVNPGVALRYHYDASGQVVGRTLDPSGANLSQFFIYDEDRIVQELDGNGDLVAEWVYGDYIDEIFAMYRDTDANGSLDATYYYIQDDLYNVVALTDENGEVVERYSYDDYGMPTVWVEDDQNPGTWIEHTDASGAPVSSVGNVFMFTGRRWDPELGLYDFRTRYYNPKLGRFLRVDTIGPWGDPANLGNPYTYLGNNPWSGTDPWGEQTTYGIAYYYDNDGNVVTIEPSGLVETLGAAATAYDETVGTVVRKLDPNPGPVRAAIENEVLMVDRSADTDLVATKNNIVYTGTQLAINFVPLSWLTKGVKWFKTGAKVVAIAGEAKDAGNLRVLVATGDNVGRGTRRLVDQADSALRAADKPLVLAKGPRSHLNAAIAEAHGFDDALKRGHVAIKEPGKVTSTGPDFITLDPDTEIIHVADAKYRQPGGQYPKSIPTQKMVAWKKDVSSAIERMPEGPYKDMAREALQRGSVKPEVFRWPN